MYFWIQFTKMRFTLVLVILVLAIVGCKKDKFTTAPQIRFLSVDPNYARSDLTPSQSYLAPKITLEITDAEGDFGYRENTDTSLVYLKNLKTDLLDSLIFPDIRLSGTKNFKAEIEVNLFKTLRCLIPGPRVDTLYYEVYITDFAGNKSNVITTDQPVFFECL